MAKQHHPSLVLTDVMMPKMDGFQLCRLLKGNDDLKTIPVLMLTARADEQGTLEGFGSGADDYLAKPFSVPELKARVVKLLTLRERFGREVLVQPTGVMITPEEEVFLDQVLEVVEAHLGDEQFGVDWLADEVGLSRRQLQRRLEKVSNMTPSEVIRRLRLERARQLLERHAGTVAEVAYAVGFRSPSYFTKAFRKAYGTTPTKHVERWG